MVIFLIIFYLQPYFPYFQNHIFALCRFKVGVQISCGIQYGMMGYDWYGGTVRLVRWYGAVGTVVRCGWYGGAVRWYGGAVRLVRWCGAVGTMAQCPGR